MFIVVLICECPSTSIAAGLRRRLAAGKPADEAAQESHATALKAVQDVLGRCDERERFRQSLSRSRGAVGDGADGQDDGTGKLVAVRCGD